MELRRRLEAEFEEQLTHLTSTCQLMRDSFDADYQQCVDKLREQFEALLHQASSTEKAGDEVSPIPSNPLPIIPVAAREHPQFRTLSTSPPRPAPSTTRPSLASCTA